MNTTRNAPRAEAVGHLNNASRAFIRLSLSRNDAGDKVFRSIVVDVLPQRLLDSSDPRVLNLWGERPYVLDNGDVFFFCGWLSNDTILQWFTRPDDCVIMGFNQEPGYRTRQESFTLPDTHDTVSAIDLPSFAPHGLPPIPFPFTLYTLYLKSPHTTQNRDYKEVIGPDGELFDTFPTAQAEVIFGMTDRRAMYGRNDLFAFRVIDARGWLEEIRVLPDKVLVTLGATDIPDRSFVVVRGSQFNERTQVLSHQVSLSLPERIPDDVQVTLLGGNAVLDTAAFSSAKSLYPKNSPQVIVERKDIFGYVEPATTNMPISAPTEGIAAKGDAPPKIFVSHSHVDEAFAERLVADLRAAGADAWLDKTDLGAGDFQERISAALGNCEWLVLVLTRNALTSQWVRHEVNAAIILKHAKQIRELIFIQAGPLEYSELPALWRVFNVFDAIADYSSALDRVVNEVGVVAQETRAPVTYRPSLQQINKAVGISIKSRCNTVRRGIGRL